MSERTYITGQTYEVQIGQYDLSDSITLAECHLHVTNEAGEVVYTKEANAAATVSTLSPTLTPLGNGHYALKWIFTSPSSGQGDWMWRIWSADGLEAHDTVPVVAATAAPAEEATPEITDPVIRRVRRIVGEFRECNVFTDAEIKYAYADELTDNVNAALGVEYVVTYDDAGEITGVATDTGTDLTAPEYRVLALATAISLVTGLHGELARDAISTDSPRGRLNTTVAPEAVARFLDDLKAKYTEALDKAVGVDSDTPIAFADLTDMMTDRGYPAEV